MRSLHLAVYCVISVCLQGCSSWLPPSRFGPDPVLKPDDVATSTNNQVDVLDSIRAAYGDNLGATDQKDYYYRLTLAGFNYIDQVCDVYIENLFKMDRRKNRLRDILALTATASSAVLTAADVSKDAMAIVTAALGYTSGMLTVTADSYLYQAGPTKAYRVVRALQSGYRKDLADKKGRIIAEPLVIYELRSYLSLCFPVTIESHLDQAFASFEATADPGNKVTTELSLTTPAAAKPKR